MYQFVQDLRYAIRLLARTPWATATAVIALGLGILAGLILNKAASKSLIAFVDTNILSVIGKGFIRLVQITEKDAGALYQDLSFIGNFNVGTRDCLTNRAQCLIKLARLGLSRGQGI